MRLISFQEEFDPFVNIYDSLEEIEQCFRKHSRSLSNYHYFLNTMFGGEHRVILLGGKNEKLVRYADQYFRSCCFGILFNTDLYLSASGKKREAQRLRIYCRQARRRLEDKEKYKNFSHDNNERMATERDKKETAIWERIDQQGYIWIKVFVGKDRELTWVKQGDLTLTLSDNAKHYCVSSLNPAFRCCPVTRVGKSFLIEEPKNKKVRESEE